MKNKHLIILIGILIVAILIGFILINFIGFTWLFCPIGWIRDIECGPIDTKSVCYKPMEDAGKECASASDCKGACTTDLIDQCKKIDGGERFGVGYSFEILAICDSNIKGKCSPAKSIHSANNLLNYSDIPVYTYGYLYNLTDYNITENNKIIIKKHLACI